MFPRNPHACAFSLASAWALPPWQLAQLMPLWPCTLAEDCSTTTFSLPSRVAWQSTQVFLADSAMRQGASIRTQSNDHRKFALRILISLSGYLDTYPITLIAVRQAITRTIPTFTQ